MKSFFLFSSQTKGCLNFWAVISVDKTWCFMCKDWVNCNHYLYPTPSLLDASNHVADAFSPPISLDFSRMENKMPNHFSVKFLKRGQ